MQDKTRQKQRLPRVDVEKARTVPLPCLCLCLPYPSTHIAAWTGPELVLDISGRSKLWQTLLFSRLVSSRLVSSCLVLSGLLPLVHQASSSFDICHKNKTLKKNRAAETTTDRLPQQR